MVGLLPTGAFPRVRTRLYRLAGVQIGAGTTITGPLRIAGGQRAPRNLQIGSNCYLNDDIYIDAGARVSLGDGVSMGMRCLLITATHNMGDPLFRAGNVSLLPLRIDNGCWLAANVTVLPGVTIGPGTVVGAGAVVAKDLPGNVFAAGVPARVQRSIEEGGA